MPILSLHASRPPVTIANKTPVRFVPPGIVNESGGNGILGEILKKLTAIETELGIQTPADIDPEHREILMQRLELARVAKAEKMRMEDEKKKEFLKRMRRGKKKAAKKRGE